MRILALFIFPLLTLTGCFVPADVGCVSDDECRSGRICFDNRCVDPSDDLRRNNDDNNDDNNELNNQNNFNNNNEPFNNVNNEPFNNVNNEPFNNEPFNNEPFNNEPFNNQNNGNNDPFNNISGDCEDAGDCPGEEVCTGLFDDGGICVDPWECENIVRIVERDFCEFQFACDADGRFLFLFCEFGDRDEGFCFCEDPELGGVEFEASRDVCDDPDEVFDFANVHCGWQLPGE